MKRWIVLVLASLILLSLCSCAETAEESSVDVSSATQDESTPENEPAQQSSADSETGVLSHSTISETWDSGVVVDADVTAIKEETLSTYTGELRVFTVDELAEAFGLSVDSATSSITDDSLEGYVPGTYTYLEFEDNRILISNMAQFSYESEPFIKTRDLLSVHGNEANADAFLTGNDLDFATIEQAQAEIQAVLDKLEIPVIQEPRCYTLDYESLYAENERQYEIVRKAAEGFDQTFVPEKLEILEEDACYMFYYPVAIDGMPISPFLNGVYGDGSLMTGTELIACYNKDGLAGLALEYQPLMQEKSEAQPVIPLEEILEKEKAKYDSIILEGEYTIYDIRLEYIAQPVTSEENTYNLIPVWRFSIEHRYEQAAKTEGGESFEVIQNTYDLYDALTGEEIPYNAGSI